VNRDLMQFATFTTNFRHVLCDLFTKRDLTRLLTVYSETGLETKIQRGARTGGTYYVPINTHRDICNKPLS